jgi:hypothetical protein
MKTIFFLTLVLFWPLTHLLTTGVTDFFFLAAPWGSIKSECGGQWPANGANFCLKKKRRVSGETQQKMYVLVCLIYNKYFYRNFGRFVARGVRIFQNKPHELQGISKKCTYVPKRTTFAAVCAV